LRAGVYRRPRVPVAASRRARSKESLATRAIDTPLFSPRVSVAPRRVRARARVTDGRVEKKQRSATVAASSFIGLQELR
jgi:hypothetical protein|tara:strand:- start:389 stop:625 length:237 start_codon:yes stop_codon:yes gene_type:complete